MDTIEKLTIDTPEQVDLEFPLAGIGSRFLAVFVDTLIQFVLYFILGLVAAYGTPRLFDKMGASHWVDAVAILFVFCIYWGYYAIFETVWAGQTPGKRMAKIRVIKDSGRPITAFEAVARNLLRIIDQLPGIYGVGVVVAFLNKRNRRLGDYVAGTVVVHERKEEEVQNIWAASTNMVTPALDTSPLSTRELEVIETFLGRRLDLALDVRHATAEKLANLFAARLNIPPEGRPSHEDFLEAVAAQIRNSTRFRHL